jgi:hypothetical protein
MYHVKIDDEKFFDCNECVEPSDQCGRMPPQGGKV